MYLFRTMPTPGDFAPLFRLLDDYDVHRSSSGRASSLRSFTPRFDVRESKGSYHLDGELPGIPQESIDIEFSDPQTLVIKGRSESEFRTPNTPQDQEDEDENNDVVKMGDRSVTRSENKNRYLVSERSVGEFQRSFAFPGRVDQDNVKASLKNGILSVTVPKANASCTKKVTIE